MSNNFFSTPIKDDHRGIRSNSEINVSTSKHKYIYLLVLHWYLYSLQGYTGSFPEIVMALFYLTSRKTINSS